MALALDGWDVDLSFASNGLEAIDAIHNGKANLLFLDLNMPVMDGYQVLKQVREQDLPTLVIIVSGDIQNSDSKKVNELGAIAFVAKPINLEKLKSVINEFGLAEQIPLKKDKTESSAQSNKIPATQEERFQEAANISMGKTAKRLSSLLETYVNLSVPNVDLIDHAELYNTISDHSEKDSVATISQGFVGGGISGESILMVNKSGLPHISSVLGLSTEIDQDLERDLLVYLAGLLSSSFLEAYFQQIGVAHINQGIPSFIDFKGQLDHLLKERPQQKILSIEINYSIPSYQIYCCLMLVFTLDSIEPMNQRSELFSWTL
jgi:prepilin-type processing-associated H-X9-DG protein